MTRGARNRGRSSAAETTGSSELKDTELRTETDEHTTLPPDSSAPASE
jgi:hypothetical protein